jgi:hypothetical protein
MMIKLWQERLGSAIAVGAPPMGAIEHAMQAEIDELRSAITTVTEALHEADRLMGHDDATTEWREKWAHLWRNVG